MSRFFTFCLALWRRLCAALSDFFFMPDAVSNSPAGYQPYTDDDPRPAHGRTAVGQIGPPSKPPTGKPGGNAHQRRIALREQARIKARDRRIKNFLEGDKLQ